MSKYIVGITGASGSIYAVRIIEELLKQTHEVHLTITENGRKVMAYETGRDDKDILGELNGISGRLFIHDIHDLFAPIASGSFKTDGMVVVPCSMATIGEMATGSSKSLLGRAADVCIKEKRRLVLVARETPLSSIHLRNMLTLSEAGAVIFPAMPAFYNKPAGMRELIDQTVGRVLDSLGVKNKLYKEWGS